MRITQDMVVKAILVVILLLIVWLFISLTGADAQENKQVYLPVVMVDIGDTPTSSIECIVVEVTENGWVEQCVTVYPGGRASICMLRYLSDGTLYSQDCLWMPAAQLAN